MAIVTLLPNASGSGVWSAIPSAIDEGMTSPDGTEALPQSTGTSGDGNSHFIGLEALPGGFSEVTMVEVRFRYRMDPANYADDLVSIDFQMFQSDESTSLTDSVNSGNVTSTTRVDSGWFTMANPTSTTSKSIWDASFLKIINNYSNNMGGDNSFIRIDAIEVRITYDVAGTQHTKSIAGSTTPTGAVTNVVIPPSWSVYRPTSDESIVTWVTTPIWSKVDDNPTLSSSESDEVTAAGGGTARLGLATLTQPDVFVGWRIRVRAKRVTGTKTLRVLLVRKDTGGAIGLQDSIQTLVPITGSYQWFELPIRWAATVNPASIALSNFAIALVADGLNSGTVAVAAVELRIPLLSGAPFGSPGFADLSMTAQGRIGPYTANSKQWIVGVDETEKVAWAFSATNPSNGHNPSDWTREFPVGELPPQAPTTGVPVSSSNRTTIDMVDTSLNSSNELVVTTRALISGFEGEAHTTPTNGDPASGAASYNHTSSQAAGHFLARFHQRTTTPFENTVVFDYAPATGLRGIKTGGSTTTIVSGNHTLFDAVWVPTPARWHVFYSVADNDHTSGIRQRTWRANNSLQTAPGSDATSEDHARLGVGATYRNASNVDRVVSPHPQADGGGITALTLDSADSPTPSLETVTTRDAYDAAYEQSVVAIPVGTTHMAVLWIDDAADAIWGAIRVDGASTWSSEGELVTGVTGRTRLSGGPLDADTVAIAVAIGSGDIYYYEITFTLGVAVGVVTETETAQAVIALAAQTVAVGSVGETETAQAVAVVTPGGAFTGWGIPMGIP